MRAHLVPQAYLVAHVVSNVCANRLDSRLNVEPLYLRHNLVCDLRTLAEVQLEVEDLFARCAALASVCDLLQPGSARYTDKSPVGTHLAKSLLVLGPQLLVCGEVKLQVLSAKGDRAELA